MNLDSAIVISASGISTLAASRGIGLEAAQGSPWLKGAHGGEAATEEASLCEKKEGEKVEADGWKTGAEAKPIEAVDGAIISAGATVTEAAAGAEDLKRSVGEVV